MTWDKSSIIFSHFPVLKGQSHIGFFLQHKKIHYQQYLTTMPTGVLCSVSLMSYVNTAVGKRLELGSIKNTITSSTTAAAITPTRPDNHHRRAADLQQTPLLAPARGNAPLPRAIVPKRDENTAFPFR
jgi:hypothetical protein